MDKRELEIPPNTAKDAKARELARIWVTGDAMHVTLAATAWDDPGMWGIALVDLARHVANAFEKSGKDRAEALLRIRELFDAEWARPTSPVTGRLLGRRRRKPTP